jgi:hypothetical protein
MIAQRFLDECLWELESDFDPFDAEELVYQTFTNMLDSHVWFDSPRVQRRFEAWRESVERG